MFCAFDTMKEIASANVQDESTFMTVGIFRIPRTTAPVLVTRLRTIEPLFTPDFIESFVLRVVLGKPYSLRLLDWMVVNYAKRHNVSYKVRDELGSEFFFSMRQSYNQWMTNYRRKGFDVFRRFQRCYFAIGDEWYATTIAQLNFIVWLKTYDVIPWLDNNCKKVDADMQAIHRQSREDRALKKRKRRSELVAAPKRVVLLREMNRQLVFESRPAATEQEMSS